MRQALGFGAIASLIGLAALLWPLVLSLLLGSILATVLVYALALLVDVALFILWLVRAIGYSKRALRGETFEIPLVALWNRRQRTKP